jgi:hypothetical protein
MEVSSIFSLEIFMYKNFRISSMLKLRVQLKLNLNLIDLQIFSPKNAMIQFLPKNIK